MGKHKRLVGAVMGLALAGTLTAIPTGATSAPAPKQQVSTLDEGSPYASSPEVPAQLRTKERWSRERMRNAEPLDEPGPLSPLARQSRGSDAQLPGKVGGPDLVASAAPASVLNSAAEPLATRPRWKSRAARRPYTRNLQTRTAAKMFFRRNGADWSCSASVVNSRSKDMVSTAGHCVSDGLGTWSRDVIVVPAYNSTKRKVAPLGVWEYKSLTALGEWHERQNLLFDVGYVKVMPKRQRIVKRVGGIGTRFGAPRGKRVVARGYPASGQFNGQIQRYCGPNPKLRKRDDPYGGFYPGPQAMGVKCNMTHGASGGPWISRVNGRPAQTSLTSYGYTSGPKRSARVFYGPYFGGAVKGLFRYTITN